MDAKIKNGGCGPVGLCSAAAILLCTGLISGCMTPEDQAARINNSPVRIFTASEPLAAVRQTLLLPPLGIESPAMQKQVQQQLYSAALRHLSHPIQLVSPDSAYAKYITARNLINSDGTLNASEVMMVGQLMNASHILCPIFREIRPYHPQRIMLSITVVETESGNVPGELSAVFDARQQDVRNGFSAYSKQQRAQNETKEDLFLKLRSPAAFMNYVTDACFARLAECPPLQQPPDEEPVRVKRASKAGRVPAHRIVEHKETPP